MRNETEQWLDTYADPRESLRRKAKLRRRLEAFDWSAVNQTTRWLDLCCGHGEALDLLLERGIVRPSGMDLTEDQALAVRKDVDWRKGDATQTSYPEASFDVVSNFHALHHLGTADNVRALVHEAHRVLKPGGQLWVIDFPNSWAIRAAFAFFRIRFFGFENWWFGIPYFKSFSGLVREEWPFLKTYLPQWPQVRAALLEDPRFEIIQNRRSLFYFYLQLRKRVS